MRIEEEIKLDYSDVLFRPKRSTLKSRKDVDIKLSNYINDKELRSFLLQNLNFKYLLIIFSTFLFCFFSFGIINSTLICLMIISCSIIFYFSANSNDSAKIDNNLSNFLIIVCLVFGPVAIWFAADGITMTGLKIIEQVGLSSALVGSIFLALSTSFPEIVASLISLFKYGKNDLY